MHRASFTLFLLGSLLLARASWAEPAVSAMPTDHCIAQAAQYHNVHPGVLRAVLMVESGLKERAINFNANGTKDIGIGQINSIHLRELATYGIAPEHLLNACVGTYVAAWFLNRQIRTYGNTWQGIASYHSTTPLYNQRYAQKLYQQMVRDGWIEGSINIQPLKIRNPRGLLNHSANIARNNKLRSPMMIEVQP